MYDKMYLGQVELRKFDSKTNACESVSAYASLEGAIYGIYKMDGSLMNQLIIDSDCSAISTRNLLLGDYYIQEITPPKGYKIDTEKHYFSVTKDNADEIISIVLEEDIYETKLVVNKNYLVFNNVISESDAAFSVYLKENQQKVASLFTDSNGFSMALLPYGEYIIKQEKGIKGYRFVEDIMVTVNEYSDKYTYLTLLNQPFCGTLEIVKIDYATGQYLANATIVVYNENEDVVYQGTTDDFGKIVVNDLTYGKYYILEKEAPKGYALSEEKIYFEISSDQQIVTVTLANEQEIHVPNTESNEVDLLKIMGISTIFIGVILFIYEKKNN